MSEMITINPPADFKYEAGKPIQIPAASLDFKQLIPKDYSEKPYVKKFEGDGGFKISDFFKSFDEAQAALGRPRYSAPAGDAPEDEWQKFLAAIRPEKADDYEFEQMKDVPDQLKASPEYQAEVRKMFHAAGLNKQQAKRLQKEWDGYLLKQWQAEVQKREKDDLAFSEAMKTSFGDKAEEKVGRAKKILEAVLPKELAPGIQKLPNEALQIMAIFANSMADKYMKEDDIPGSGNTGTSVAELRQKAMNMTTELMKLPATDPRKDEMNKQITDIYRQIEATEKSSKRS